MAGRDRVGQLHVYHVPIVLLRGDHTGEFGRSAVGDGFAQIRAAAVAERAQKRARLRVTVRARPGGDRQDGAGPRQRKITEQSYDEEECRAEADSDNPTFHEWKSSMYAKHVPQNVAGALFLLFLITLIMRLVAAAE